MTIELDDLYEKYEQFMKNEIDMDQMFDELVAFLNSTDVRLAVYAVLSDKFQHERRMQEAREAAEAKYYRAGVCDNFSV